MMKFKYCLLYFLAICATGCTDFFVANISDKEVTVLAPVNNAVISNGQVEFWWEKMNHAERYRLLIVSPTFDSVVHLYADTLVSNIQFTMDLPAGSYQWRVAGVNSEYSSKYTMRSFEVDTGTSLTGKTVTLNTPVNGSNLNYKNIFFSWQELDGASFYRLQIDSNGVQKYEFTPSLENYSITLGEGQWSWRVRAENTLTISAFSGNSHFSVDVSGPATPVLLTPVNNAMIAQTSTLNWQSEAGIAYDSVYVYTDATLQTREISASSITQSYLLPFLASGDYYWQVYSFDAAGNRSNGSTIFKFDLP